MPVGKYALMAIVPLVLAVLVAAWMLRFKIIPVEGSVIVHDRWSGHVEACRAQNCVRLFPSAELDD